MKFWFHSLKLTCRRSEELIDLDHQISFFHGRLSAGKSTIARLISFCLGGSLEQTTAIQQEFIAAQLTLTIGTSRVLIERNHKENQLQVSWLTDVGEPYSVLVAAKGDGAEVIPGVRNLSDLILHLLGIPVIKVRRRTEDAASPLTRLSMRDIFEFCYLPQEDLDSAFFNLMVPIRKEKSKDVLNYVMGFYSDRLSVLLIEYDDLASEQRSKQAAAKKISEFLSRFEFGSEVDIDIELAAIANELMTVEKGLSAESASFQEATHFADDVRSELRQLIARLAREEDALEDIERRLEEQRQLRSELISMKFKTARTDRARNILAGAKFHSCPNCGEKVDQHRAEGDICYLCLQPPTPEPEGEKLTGDIVRADLDSRISEVDAYIRRQEKAREAEQSFLAKLRIFKSDLERKLTLLLADYESAQLSRTREAERRRATLEERRRFLEKMRELPDAVRKMEEEADQLTAKLAAVDRDINREKAKLAKADENFTLLEEYFLDALVSIGLPGTSPEDVARINRKTLVAEVLSHGAESLTYSFFNAGSGGKKVLITICFALALHRVAAIRHLPLPSFLIIDSPTKNITPDINPELVEAFYAYLYKLAESDLSNTQFILIDQSLAVPPEDSPVTFSERLMQSGDPDHPPLISYYNGP